mgnify:CR=1 FL=1
MNAPDRDAGAQPTILGADDLKQIRGGAGLGLGIGKKKAGKKKAGKKKAGKKKAAKKKGT